MKKRLLIAAAVIFIGTSIVTGQNVIPDWYASVNRFTLLVSGYEDVSKTFGRPAKAIGERKYSEYIESPEGRFHVSYETGKCVENHGNRIGWKVPEWTVIELSFIPRKPIEPRQLPFELNGFRSYPISDVPGAFVYENDDVGISYDLNRKRKVEVISFYPPTSMKHLHC